MFSIPEFPSIKFIELFLLLYRNLKLLTVIKTREYLTKFSILEGVETVWLKLTMVQICRRYIIITSKSSSLSFYEYKECR